MSVVWVMWIYTFILYIYFSGTQAQVYITSPPRPKEVDIQLEGRNAKTVPKFICFRQNTGEPSGSFYVSAFRSFYFDARVHKRVCLDAKQNKSCNLLCKFPPILQ